jgi:hypothetical protein
VVDSEWEESFDYETQWVPGNNNNNNNNDEGGYQANQLSCDRLRLSSKSAGIHQQSSACTTSDQETREWLDKDKELGKHLGY